MLLNRPEKFISGGILIFISLNKYLFIFKTNNKTVFKVIEYWF